MSVNFSVSINKAQLAKMEERLLQELSSPAAVQAVKSQILAMPSVRRWLNFLGSTDFVSDFGVPASIAARMRSQFQQEVQEVRVTRGKGFVSYQAIDQENLRSITSWQWDTVQVNAWDAYEYGIIGGRRARGITGSHIDRTLSNIEKRFSRTGFALMKPGGSFKLHTGQAPPVFGVRSEFANSAERFAEGIRKKVRI